MSSPPNPSCLVMSTHYQVCNHLTLSINHAKIQLPPSQNSLHNPSERRSQTIIKCPQAIHNLSLFPPPAGKAQMYTTRCSEIEKRTRVNGGYGCPYCEPDMHRTGEAVSEEMQFEDSEPGDDTEARTKRRVKWCRKVIEEWERKEKEKAVHQVEATTMES
ncbi:hypothetical protein ACMFMG_002809 [Clarireedia jacksonii]